MRIIHALITILLAIGCQEKMDGPYKVKLPVEQENGSVSFQVVELKTLQDPDKVESNLIRVRLNTRVYSDGLVDEQVPRAQYVLTDDKVIIPKDATTGQLFALYKLMEDIYFEDQKSGVSQLLKYPRTVSLQTKSFNSIQSGFDNSSYNSISDTISVFKTSKSDAIPISFQKTVIAHEHFHAIQSHAFNFQGLILGSLGSGASLRQPLPNSKEKESLKSLTATQKWNYMLLKTFEEGLADFWSYNISGREKLYETLSKDLSYRNVDGTLRIIDSFSSLEAMLDFDKYHSENVEHQKEVGSNVELLTGTFSNFLKKLADVQKIQAGKERALWMLNSLSKLKNILKENFNQKLSISKLVSAFYSEENKSANKEETCEYLNNFLILNETISECI